MNYADAQVFDNLSAVRRKRAKLRAAENLVSGRRRAKTAEASAEKRSAEERLPYVSIVIRREGKRPEQRMHSRAEDVADAGNVAEKKPLPPMSWTSAEEKGVVPLKNDGISQLDLE